MKRRGVTIAEALLTLVLVAMLMGITAYLMAEYGRILRFSAAKDNTWLAAQVGVQRAVGEVREAVAVLTPAAGATANELRFRKIDPADPTWLPTPIPSPAPATWDPYPPALLLEVCYRSDGQGTLIREVGPAGGAPVSTQAVCEGITGFRCDNPGDGTVVLILSVQEEKLVRSLTS
ncbi:MAG: hypothetical protein AB1758_21045, partial [Candidatus Eremiobacterota bacterium]